MQRGGCRHSHHRLTREFRSLMISSPNAQLQREIRAAPVKLQDLNGSICSSHSPQMSSHKSLQRTKASSGREHGGMMELCSCIFLDLLIPSEEYLEFLISSTCLGVNAKMHGLSWSFSLFCGTEEGRKERPSKWEQQLWARGDCYALFISKSGFLPHPRIPVFTCFGHSALIRALLIYCSLLSTTRARFGFDFSLF